MIGTIRDAITMLAARPWKTLAQGAGIALGAGLFVIVLGLGSTISSQVDERFDEIQATTVWVETSQTYRDPVEIKNNLDNFITRGDVEKTKSVPGIQGISRVGVQPDQTITFRVVPQLEPIAEITGSVMVADTDLLDTLQADVSGKQFNHVDQQIPRKIAVIGTGIAKQVGITRPGSFLQICGENLQIVGIVNKTNRMPDVLNSVLVSEKQFFSVCAGEKIEYRAILNTLPGAAQVVAKNLALNLRPDHPEYLSVIAPPAPQNLRRSVSTDVQNLSVGSAVIVLLAGTFAAGNLMMLSVASRVKEIGMRKALGASGWEIMAMILTEAGTVGVISAVIGNIVGIWVMLGVSILNQWSPVLDFITIWVSVAAAITGSLIGGFFPALIAAKVSPATALRA